MSARFKFNRLAKSAITGALMLIAIFGQAQTFSAYFLKTDTLKSAHAPNGAVLTYADTVHVSAQVTDDGMVNIAIGDTERKYYIYEVNGDACRRFISFTRSEDPALDKQESSIAFNICNGEGVLYLSACRRFALRGSRQVAFQNIQARSK